MNTTKQFKRSFKVGRFTVEFTADLPALPNTVANVEFEWTPYFPKKLPQKHRAEYERKRDAVFAAYSEEAGTPIEHIDLLDRYQAMPDNMRQFVTRLREGLPGVPIVVV